MIERIGIVGGGQLGMMLTEAAVPLGFQVLVTDPSDFPPAIRVGADWMRSSLSNTDTLNVLAEKTDLLTWEIEHIPAEHLVSMEEKGVRIEPSPQTLLDIQDKFIQKQMLAGAGIPVAPFGLPGGAARKLDGPYVVKSRKGGYDGRGNKLMDVLDQNLIAQSFDTPVYAEQQIRFDKELAVVAVRSAAGKVATYPVVETIHHNNICHLVYAPAPIDPKLEGQAVDLAHETMKLMKGAGVFAMEMFAADDTVMINEIAPRVHNSGHFTIEGCDTSQFANHIRAITGLPLGSAAMRAPAAVMINILGRAEGPLNREGLDKVLQLKNVYPHFYGKSPRPERKIGHITALGDTLQEANTHAVMARDFLVV